MSRETVLIVGGGIAGLWIADQLAATHSVTVLEKYDYLGGRILTSKRGFEIGAGRIHTSHKRVRELISRFKLHTSPIKSESQWLPLAAGGSAIPNRFDVTWSAILDQIKHLPASTLATTTLRQLAEQIMGPRAAAELLEHYPYRSEVETLRADIGITAFESEMGSDAGFFTVVGGLSAITRGLAASIHRQGGTIHLNTPVRAVRPGKRGWYVTTDGESPTLYNADRVILALHADAIRTIRTVAPLVHALPHLKMTPLTRIYAQYPRLNWLADGGRRRFVTDSPVRYCIPINPAAGLVMISYIEDRDTHYWRGLKGDALAAKMGAALRALLPDVDIPEPSWIHAYEWSEGCTYWTPGTYSPQELSQQALEPAPRLHCVGESFCVGRQAWIEGALCHAAQLLDRINP